MPNALSGTRNGTNASLLALALMLALGPAPRAVATSTNPMLPPLLGMTDRESVQQFETEPTPRPNSPNVIYIVLDDVGFSDLGSFGSEILTPNMDALARNGLRYNNFHTKAICSPTRAALLTGRNSHSVGMSNVANLMTGFPSGQGRIAISAATIAELLQAAGYRTYALGKWHLNPDNMNSSRSNWPLGRGFDQYYGFLEGMTDQYTPELIQDNTPVDVPRRANYHISEDLVDHAISYIATETAVSPNRPFFMYLAFGAAHAPHQVAPRYIEKYVPIFQKGWDQTRVDRLARQKALGIVPADAELPPSNPGIRPWSDLSSEEKAVAIRFQATYAGFLEHTDEQIGRLMAFLDETGRRDNTLIVLLSDNGGSKEGEFEGTLNELQTLTQRHSTASEMAKRLDEFGQPSTSENYPMGWTQASNTPFRYYKTTNWDGGIRTPLIIDWPAHLQKEGQVRTQFVDAIDVTPTILDVVGITAPVIFKGMPQIPFAGRSIAATFTDAGAPAARDTQYFELMGQRTIWHDGWQAVAQHKPGTSFEADRWQLFNLKHDFASVHDVAAANPAVLEEMKARWWAEAGKYGALPLVEAPLADAFTPGKGPGGLALKTRFKARRDPRPEYSFFPQQERLSMQEAPALRGPSYSFAVTTKPLNGSEEGVLFADGDQFGGYCLFLRNGQLSFAYNDLGIVTRVSAPQSATKDATRLRFAFERTGPGGGTGRLYADDRLLASGPIQQPDALLTALAGFDVGRDGGGHVVPDYAGEGDYAFPIGKIQKLVVTVGPTRQ